MLIRAALLIALAPGAGLPAAANPLEARHSGRCSVSVTQPVAGEGSVAALRMQQLARLVCMPAPARDPQAGPMNGRSAETHVRELLQFAIYASIGNRDGMEILSSRVRKFGVTREELQDFADHSKLHDGLLPRRRRPAPDID